MKSSSLYAALVLAIAVYILHTAAIAHHFYFMYWWYDVMMHFLAGIALGFSAYWGLFRSGIIFKTEKSAKFIILSVLLPVMVVGVGWEIFEYVNDIAGPTFEGYALDTTNDLLLDACGSVLAALIASRKKRHG